MVDRKTALVLLAVTLVASSACARRRTAPTTQPAPPPAVMPAPPAATGGGGPVQPVTDAQPVATTALAEDRLDNRSLDDLNRDSPLRPAFFPLDSADLDDAGRTVVAANGDVLKKFPSWVVTIEGHCDERGTAEYNLALGERRAAAVKTYLVSLGIAPERVRTVSYGKEFPFDTGHTDNAWAQNRRAHFVITAR